MLRIIGTEYNPAHQAFEVYVAGCTQSNKANYYLSLRRRGV